MNKLRLKYTANFKRDYVAVLAVVFFFLIVISEILLAVSLPFYMRRDSTMALSVRRLRLLDSFDAARRTIVRMPKPKDPKVSSEVALLKWNLDLMADYLRRYAKGLSSSEIAVLQEQLNEMTAALTELQAGKAFSREDKLDYAPYLEYIMKKSGVADVR